MAILAAAVLPCAAAENEPKDEKSIWVEEEPRGPREPGGPPPGESRGRRGPRRRLGRDRKFELTDEEIGRIMKGLKESDPEKAEKLEKLRAEDPNRFRFELGRHGGEEFGRIVRERISRWRNQRRDEFLQWLEKNYKSEAEKLEALKEKDPKLYDEKFESVRRKYWHIFEEERRNPELADVLKEDLELKNIRDKLVAKIKDSKDEREKKLLAGELEEVVGRRFDLIIRRKQIEYERLLKRVQELQKRLEESKAEIDERRDEQFKNENVKNRVSELTGEASFKWD